MKRPIHTTNNYRVYLIFILLFGPFLRVSWVSASAVPKSTDYTHAHASDGGGNMISTVWVGYDADTSNSTTVEPVTNPIEATPFRNYNLIYLVCGIVVFLLLCLLTKKNRRI